MHELALGRHARRDHLPAAERVRIREAAAKAGIAGLTVTLAEEFEPASSEIGAAGTAMGAV